MGGGSLRPSLMLAGGAVSWGLYFIAQACATYFLQAFLSEFNYSAGARTHPILKSLNPLYQATGEMRDLDFAITLAALSLMVGSAAAARKCYFPDGRSSDGNYVPCFPNNEKSFCCHMNDYCTQNSLCLSVLKGYHYRGGCTDPDWLSDSCPKACLGDQNCSLLHGLVLSADARMALMLSNT